MTRGEFGVKAHAQFREMVMSSRFPCLGAKAALNDKAYLFATYDDMAEPGTTTRLGRGLAAFAKSDISRRSDYSTFIAVFRAPLQLSEAQFEALLWKQLRGLRAIDQSPWDERVSSDPADPHFSFSFGRQAFYVLGMHANSSRAARRFPWPTLVFNPHAQFERLRHDGKWKRMQHSIREREMASQGSVNPMLSEFGERSEARQYSGRAVSEEWKCPFH